MSDVTVKLDAHDWTLIIEALEAAEYWAWGTHGDPPLPVDNGYLWLPGDSEEGEDRYWPEEPDPAQQEKIDEVRRMRRATEVIGRALSHKLVTG